MIPNTLSASSLKVAEGCLSRWEAEYFTRAKGPGGNAAMAGTAAHGGLEAFVQKAIMGTEMPRDLKTLKDLYKLSYIQTFDSFDTDTQIFKEGIAMMEAWFERTVLAGYFDQVEVVSCEQKKRFPLKLTDDLTIPFTYILDRFDRLDENSYKVVDYKTNAWDVTHEQLRKMIQPRAYSLAKRLEYPQAKEIWVEFDMLRHSGGVGVVYTKDDDIATWKYLRQLAWKIVETPPGEAPEKLNPECRFCVKKSSCKALFKNLTVGGIVGKTAAELVDLRADAEYQKAAIVSLVSDIDAIILEQAKSEDVLSYESKTSKLNITVGSRRDIDPFMAERVIGPDLAKKYISGKITMADVDKLLKKNNKELTDAQKKELASYITNKPNATPSIKVETINPFGP